MNPQYLPDWFYGLVPPGWWPNRPREPFWWVMNVLPIVANSSLTAEVVFDKKVDALVFGGTIFVTDVTGTSVSAPAGGVFSRIFLRLTNPAAAKMYTATFTNNGVTSQQDTGFVCADNVLAPWTNPGSRPMFWPIPIAVPRGGSLQLDLASTASINTNLRIAFACAMIYDEAKVA